MPITFRIRPQPGLPKYDPVTGWRRITSYLFGWPRRGRVVMEGPNRVLLTHPDNVPVVITFLTQRGFQYQVEPQLQSLPGGKQ